MKNSERQTAEKGFEQDRQDYWAMRDELLAKYLSKWVAVRKGRVIAVGDEPLWIMEQALAEDGYAYSNKVGDEDKIVIRQRRERLDASFSKLYRTRYFSAARRRLESRPCAQA